MFGGGIARGLAGAMGRGRGNNQGNQGGLFAKIMAGQQGQGQVPQGPPPQPTVPVLPPGMMGSPQQAVPSQGPPPNMMGQGMGPSPEVIQQLMQRRQQMMAPAGQGMQGQGPQGMMRPQGY